MTKREQLLLRLQLIDGSSGKFFLILCLALSLIFPTLLNWLVMGLYFLATILFILSKRSDQYELSVLNSQNEPLEGVIVKVKLPNSNDVVDFDLTSQDGDVCLEIPVDKYRIETYKLGWQLKQVSATNLMLEPTRIMNNEQ